MTTHITGITQSIKTPAQSPVSDQLAKVKTKNLDLYVNALQLFIGFLLSAPDLPHRMKFVRIIGSHLQLDKAMCQSIVQSCQDLIKANGLVASIPKKYQGIMSAFLAIGTLVPSRPAIPYSTTFKMARLMASPISTITPSTNSGGSGRTVRFFDEVQIDNQPAGALAFITPTYAMLKLIAQQTPSSIGKDSVHPV